MDDVRIHLAAQKQFIEEAKRLARETKNQLKVQADAFNRRGQETCGR